MTKITVYNIEAEELEKVADANDTNVAEVVSVLCEYLEKAKEDNNWR